MAGAELPEPLAQGDLTRTPFAHVLLHVRQRALTGSLVVWDPSAEGRPGQERVRFAAGVPVAARLSVPSSRLDRSLLPLFARESGPYAFYEDVDLVGASEQVREGRIDVLPLIAASLRGSSRDDAVAHVVGSFGDSLLRLERGVDVSAMGLLPEEEAFLEMLRAEPLSAPRLVEISPLEPHLVRRLIYFLAITKSIEPWEPPRASEPAARPSEPRPSEPRESKPSPSRSERAAEPVGRSSSKSASNAKRPVDADAFPAVPEGLSAPHRAQWDEIAARTAAIEGENYFEMLKIARDVPTAAIQKAYIGLVKKWHPDRLPAELSVLRPYVETIFHHLTRAQETLCDEAKRGLYLATVQDGGGTPEAERQLGLIIQAAMEFRKVEVLMRRREWDEAIALLDAIIGMSPDEADYHATRGWLVFQRAGGEPSSHLEALASIERAIGLSEAHDKSQYYKGMILKRQGKTALALAHFTRAAELNKKNIEAVREVRLADMRSDAPAGPSGSSESLFGKLFGGKKKK